MELSAEDARFVEEYALLHEQHMPRMAGRILAALLIADEPLTAAHLSSRLDASSGSVSAMTRYLIDNQYAERTVVPGTRSKVYRVIGDASVRLWRSSFAEYARQVDLFTKRLETGVDGPVPAARLREVRRFHAYLRDALPEFLDGFEGYVGPS